MGVRFIFYYPRLGLVFKQPSARSHGQQTVCLTMPGKKGRGVRARSRPIARKTNTDKRWPQDRFTQVATFRKDIVHSSSLQLVVAVAAAPYVWRMRATAWFRWPNCFRRNHDEGMRLIPSSPVDSMYTSLVETGSRQEVQRSVRTNVRWRIVETPPVTTGFAVRILRPALSVGAQASQHKQQRKDQKPHYHEDLWRNSWALLQRMRCQQRVCAQQ